MYEIMIQLYQKINNW